jgi:hypothetical protein
MPPELQNLMELFCRLAMLLPDLDEFDWNEDADRSAEVRMVLAQLSEIKKQIDHHLKDRPQ